MEERIYGPMQREITTDETGGTGYVGMVDDRAKWSHSIVDNVMDYIGFEVYACEVCTGETGDRLGEIKGECMTLFELMTDTYLFMLNNGVPHDKIKQLWHAMYDNIDTTIPKDAAYMKAAEKLRDKMNELGLGHLEGIV